MKDPMGTRIKSYEKQSESVIPHEKYMIVRIDGHKFSKFTKDFKKPFDEIFAKTMKQTTIDLFEKFTPVTAYTQSDEITLVFEPVYKIDDETVENNQIFGGRTQKITSIMSSYASIRFNENLDNLVKSTTFFDSEYDSVGIEYEKILEAKIGQAFFDARVFSVPDETETYNTVLWRFFDCIKNSKSMFAHAYCSHKQLIGLSGKEKIQLCKDKHGVDWNKQEPKYKYGIFVKKQHYSKYSSIAQKEVLRTRSISFSCNQDEMDKNFDLILNKYYK